ncbi:hypothetical protein G6F56_006685 [Rhizopus delemar]|nr:hypothetical protein G6F56_006685 [Rhizopus delemar]
MASILVYLMSMCITYLATQIGQNFMWKNKKEDGTDKMPWPASPKGLPYFRQAYAIFEKDSYRALTRWSKQLGELFSVQIGFKRIIVINSAELAQKFFIEKEQYNLSRAPADTFESTLTDRGKTVFSAPFANYWARLRRAIHVVIGKGHHLQFEETLKSQSEALLSSINNSLKESKLNENELRDLVDIMAADTALTMTVGPTKREPGAMIGLVNKCRELERLQTNKYNRLGQFFPVFNKLADVYRLFVMDSTVTNARNALLDVILPWFNSIYIQREALQEFKKEEYTPHSTVSSIAKSLLSIDASKNDPEPEQLTKEEILINLTHITVHAQTYLASVLFSLIQRVASEPEWQTKILEAEGDEQELFAKVFLDECLRLDAPNKLLAYTPRTDYDFESSDGHMYRIDVESELVLNVDAIHNNTRYYPYPQKFAPERFMKSEKKMVSLMKEDKTGKKVANDHMAFGAGRRICLGRKISEEMLIVCLIHLIKTYQLEGGNIDDKIEIGTNLWSWTGRTETKGGAIKFIKRQ